MKRLVVVAGPTSVGKSHFVDGLLQGGFPDIRALIEMNQPSRWQAMSANSIRNGFMPPDNLEGVVLHYDFLRPYRRTTKTHDRDDALIILAEADIVVFVTLVASPAILRQRIEESELRPGRFGKSLRGTKRHLLLRQDYEHPQRVRRFYEAWLSFCSRWPGEHILVSYGDELDWSSADQWREVAKANGLDVPLAEIASASQGSRST